VDRIPLAIWLAGWRMSIRYHRYEVEGLDRLLVRDPMLVAGYHGRPAAWDLCMLSVLLYDRLGYLPHSFFHTALMKWPIGWMSRGLGAVTADGPELDAAVERGEHVFVTPGGVQEGTRSFRDKYRVHWTNRCGYVRIAARLGIPIVPTGASGVDDTFIALNNGYETSRRVGIPPNIPLWAGVGPLGFSPISPPFPVRIKTFVGEPIEDTAGGRIDPRDAEAVMAVHRKTVGAVQALLDRAVGRKEGRG